MYNLTSTTTTEDTDVTLKRKPYQSPELILLGGSAKDTANPNEKGHHSAELTPFTSHGYVHLGPQGRSFTANHMYSKDHLHTAVVS